MVAEAVNQEQESNDEHLLVPRTPDEAEKLLPNGRMGSLPVLAKICAGEYGGEPHWVDIHPTTDAQEMYNRRKMEESERVTETGQIIGNWVDEEGLVGEYLREKAETTPEINKDKVEDTHQAVYPIVGGFHMENIEEDDSSIMVHKKYRTSKYDVYFRVKQIGEEMASGQVFVAENEGYK